MYTYDNIRLKCSWHYNKRPTYTLLNADKRKALMPFFTLSCFCAQCAAVTMTSTMCVTVCFYDESSRLCHSLSAPALFWRGEVWSEWVISSQRCQSSTDFFAFIFHTTTPKPSSWRCLLKPWIKRKLKEAGNRISDSQSLKVNVGSRSGA